MSANDNIKIIQTLYEAFGQGHLEAILGAQTDDIDWATDTASTAAPWYGVRHKKERVADFFAKFGSTMEIEEFTPFSFAANDTDVLTVVRCRAKSRASGKPLDMNPHHYFVFRDGKISYYRGTEDTAQTELVLRQ
ncbi:MAG: nuclear transport factor 2 family protein [Acidimicrobiales bacterium]